MNRFHLTCVGSDVTNKGDNGKSTDPDFHIPFSLGIRNCYKNHSDCNSYVLLQTGPESLQTNQQGKRSARVPHVKFPSGLLKFGKER